MREAVDVLIEELAARAHEPERMGAISGALTKDIRDAFYAQPTIKYMRLKIVSTMDLHPSDGDNPGIWVEFEPDCAAAVVLPMGRNAKLTQAGNRFFVEMDRLIMPRLTWDMMDLKAAPGKLRKELVQQAGSSVPSLDLGEELDNVLKGNSIRWTLYMLDEPEVFVRKEFYQVESCVYTAFSVVGEILKQKEGQ